MAVQFDTEVQAIKLAYERRAYAHPTPTKTEISFGEEDYSPLDLYLEVRRDSDIGKARIRYHQEVAQRNGASVTKLLDRSIENWQNKTASKLETFANISLGI